MRIVQTYTVAAHGCMVKRFLSRESAQAHLDAFKGNDVYKGKVFPPCRIEEGFALEVDMGGVMMYFALTLMHVDE